MNQKSSVSDRLHPTNWYLIHTKAHQEKIATSTLQHLEVETLFPELRKKVFRQHKQQTVVLPLFPGYLFCCFNWSRDSRKVNYAHGVANIVKFGSIPARIDVDTIENIQSRMMNGPIVQSSTHLHQGQEVRIEGGPFHGLEAMFDQELTGTQRVALLLKHVAFHARIIIDRDQVQKVTPKTGSDHFGNNSL